MPGSRWEQEGHGEEISQKTEPEIIEYPSWPWREREVTEWKPLGAMGEEAAPQPGAWPGLLHGWTAADISRVRPGLPCLCAPLGVTELLPVPRMCGRVLLWAFAVSESGYWHLSSCSLTSHRRHMFKFHCHQRTF